MHIAAALSVCPGIPSGLFFCHGKKAHVDCLPSMTSRWLSEPVLNKIVCCLLDVAWVTNSYCFSFVLINSLNRSLYFFFFFEVTSLKLEGQLDHYKGSPL